MTDLYAVIGNPISQSKSPIIHMGFAEQTGQDINYIRIEAPLDGFAARVDAFRAEGGRGLNITAPFKLDAFAYATQSLPRARLAGAVNAMSFTEDGAIADNFDGIGLVRDIQANLGFALRGRRVLLLGAGGAARGAMLPILEETPAELVILNRTAAKAVALAAEFASHGTIVAAGYDDFDQVAAGSYDIVLNATSASLRGELPPIGADVFTRDTLAYELAYGKGLTPFLHFAKDAGSTHLADGVGMLVEQAAESFFIWHGLRPDTAPVLAALKVELSLQD